MAAILDFRSKRFWLFFAPQVTPIFPTKFQVNWPFGSGVEAKIGFQDGRRLIYKSPDASYQVSSQLAFGSGEEAKNKFSRWPPLGFPIGTILAIFDLQVTRMLPTELQVNWPFGSGEEAKNRFQDGWRPSWIFDRNDLSYI